MKAKSSILDFPRETLPANLWTYEDKETLPRLNKDLRTVILKTAETELKTFNLPLKGVFLYGGAASYQWSPGTDIDISVYTKWPEDISPEDVGKIQTAFKDIEIPYKGHPIHMFVKGPEQSSLQVEVSDAVYDVLHQYWLLPPLILPEGFDPEDYFAPLIKEAERKAKYFDEKIGKLRRSWAILKKANEALVDAREPEVVQKRIKDEKNKVKDLIEDLAEDFWSIRERRYELHDKLREKLQNNLNLGRFERFQEPEIIWKYLDRAGYNDLLWQLYKIHKGGELDSLLD
jgi:hypothetical protein